MQSMLAMVQSGFICYLLRYIVDASGFHSCVNCICTNISFNETQTSAKSNIRIMEDFSAHRTSHNSPIDYCFMIGDLDFYENVLICYRCVQMYINFSRIRHLILSGAPHDSAS